MKLRLTGNKFNNMKEQFWQWLAGLIDGDGCLQIRND